MYSILFHLDVGIDDGIGSQSRAQTPPTGDNCKYFEPKTGQLIEGEALIHGMMIIFEPGAIMRWLTCVCDYP
jgi:hypothetical protein